MTFILRHHQVTAEEALCQVRSGDRILTGTMCAEPQTLMEALVKQAKSLENVTIYTMYPLGNCDYATELMKGHLAVKIFSAGRLRMVPNKGDVEYIPCHFSQIPYLIKEKILPVDVILLQLSPPDREGYCTFGISVEHLREGMEAARLVIAEINDQMPRTHGDTSIHLSQLDYVVETSRPLISYPMETIGEVEREIAQWVLDLIPDGGVLQYGPGSVQAAILSSLKGKKDLGIHSGLITDWVVDLVEEGVITGATKTINQGKIVVTSMIGTKKLYHFVDGNPMVEVYPGSYTHSIKTLSRIKNFISINSALAVDLYGQ
ncbi:MAG: acetyl-CoA hydrolase/transferase C-terminal domain-containing protein, partial [Syntrophales bacterium]|nr:acetyl-CoA hydrolase/transferase C-terminal domain-containing protein [Syntrophales bacterium]